MPVPIALNFLQLNVGVNGVVEPEGVGSGGEIMIYGSVSAGREKWPFNVIFFLKVEPPCDQT